MSTDTAASLPLVSVITVCFNLVKNGRAGYFQECATSVHQQTYPNIEHIVIDGGSQDGTRELLETYAAKGWLRFISEPDDGIYDAMNKGIREAKGNYIAFLNADDFWHDATAIQHSVEELERTEAAFSYAPRTIIDESGKHLCTEEAGIGVFVQHMPFCHQTMFTRRDKLIQYQGFNGSKYRSAADYDLILRLILGGEKTVYVPHNFTSFRLGGFSSTASNLSSNEVFEIRAHLLGEQAAKMIEHSHIDAGLFQKLLSLVHSQVALDMLRCYYQHNNKSYRTKPGITRTFPRNGTISGNTGQIKTSYKLFGFLPLLSKTQRKGRTDFFLFGALPILRIKEQSNAQVYYLLSIIPVLKRNEML